MAGDIDIDAELYPPCPANEVVVYTAKGNLATRFEKLATEKAKDLLNNDQKILRKLAENCSRRFMVKYGIHEPRIMHHERPEWLGGAFIHLKEQIKCMGQMPQANDTIDYTCIHD